LQSMQLRSNVRLDKKMLVTGSGIRRDAIAYVRGDPITTTRTRFQLASNDRTVPPTEDLYPETAYKGSLTKKDESAACRVTPAGTAMIASMTKTIHALNRGLGDCSLILFDSHHAYLLSSVDTETLFHRIHGRLYK
jgi:hypothetical protein